LERGHLFNFMFRLIRTIFLSVLMVGICVGSYFYMTRVDRLEKFLSKKLGTEVTVKDVRVGLKTFSIEGLKIHNLHSTFLKADEIEIRANPWELLNEEISISQVRIVSPTLGIMFLNRSRSENNWSEAAHEKHSSSGERRFSIDNLRIINLQFEAVVPGVKSLALPQIPYLELHSLGKGSSLTFPALERLILEKISEQEPKLAGFFGHFPVVENEVRAPQDHLLDDGIEKVKKKTDEAVRYLKGLFS
jgi:hypothetical protein